MQIQACKANVSSFDISKAITFSRIFSKVSLTASARQVLRCLADFYNPKKGLVYPGQNTIAECTGVSSRSVNSAIKELRDNGLILTTGKSGERLNYYFTTKFFELIKIAVPAEKTAQPTTAKIAQHEQHEYKQINNNLNFKKSNFKAPQMSNNEVLYLSPDRTKEMLKQSLQIQKGSPLDLPEEQAIAWFISLPDFAKNGYFAREIKKKYNKILQN